MHNCMPGFFFDVAQQGHGILQFANQHAQVHGTPAWETGRRLKSPKGVGRIQKQAGKKAAGWSHPQGSQH